MDNNNAAEDLILVKQVLGGKKESFAVLVNKYKVPIFNLAFRMAGNKFDADDIAQETFLKAYENLRRFRIELSFFPWLYTIALNTARNSLKKKNRNRFFSPDLPGMAAAEQIPDERPNPENLLINKDRESGILQMLEILPEKYRTPFVLKYIEDHSYEEISCFLKLPPGTVKVRIYRARKLLYGRFKNRA